MNTQHTQGPWATKPQGDANFYFTTYQHPRRGNEDWLMSIQFNGELPTPEQEANVRIIDAGTDMLKALVKVETLLDVMQLTDYQVSDELDEVRAAIAKARGQS